MKNQDTHVSMTPFLVALMAFGGGLVVASNYYAQPLLALFMHEFGVSSARAGLLVTLSQLGFFVGVVFIIPLGDTIERRGLISIMTLIGAIGLFCMGIAPSFNFISIIAVLVGFSTSVAQIIVPLSAHLATPEKRGTVVSQVMGGILIGILLARTFSGVVSQHFGWRSVFISAGIAMMIFTLVFYIKVPKIIPTHKEKYFSLLKSVFHIFREEPILRTRSYFGALVFFAFNLFWTSITFMLSDQYHFSEETIGYLGLVGAAGAVAAQITGRIADKGYAKHATAISIIMIFCSWFLIYYGQYSMTSLILGLIFFDFGIQGVHIANQSEIYHHLDPKARSRVTTVYMSICFLGAGLGSAVSAAFYASIGWFGICIMGLVITVLNFILWVMKEASFPISTMKRKS